MECLGHFDSIVPSLACIPTKQWLPGVKYLLKTPGNMISETRISKCRYTPILSPKELPLVRPFQSHLLFIISLLLKNFLTALIHQRVIWTTSLLPTSAWHIIWFQVRQNTNITLSTSWFIKDAVDPWKQDGVEYVKWSKGKMRTCTHERIKVHNRDIQLSQTQTSAVLNEPVSLGIIWSGTTLSLLTENLTGQDCHSDF